MAKTPTSAAEKAAIASINKPPTEADQPDMFTPVAETTEVKYGPWAPSPEGIHFVTLAPENFAAVKVCQVEKEAPNAVGGFVHVFDRGLVATDGLTALFITAYEAMRDYETMHDDLRPHVDPVKAIREITDSAYLGAMPMDLCDRVLGSIPETDLDVEVQVEFDNRVLTDLCSIESAVEARVAIVSTGKATGTQTAVANVTNPRCLCGWAPDIHPASDRRLPFAQTKIDGISKALKALKACGAEAVQIEPLSVNDGHGYPRGHIVVRAVNRRTAQRMFVVAAGSVAWSIG
jgi:hypothetical protein